MKKHTMQEIADFFGCYVAQFKNGSVFFYSAPPLLFESAGGWAMHSDEKLRLKFDSKTTSALVDTRGHDWRVLVEPHAEASHE